MEEPLVSLEYPLETKLEPKKPKGPFVLGPLFS